MSSQRFQIAGEPRSTRWTKFNKRFRTEIDDVHAPDRNEEYLIYQTLVGAWPLSPMDDAQYEGIPRPDPELHD